MVVHIKELSGARIKKSLGAFKVAKRWHNKNKSGGNFGINIYPRSTSLNDQAYEITGYHNTKGYVTRLRFSELYQAVGPSLITKENWEAATYEDILLAIKELIDGGWTRRYGGIE